MADAPLSEGRAGSAHERMMGHSGTACGTRLRLDRWRERYGVEASFELEHDAFGYCAAQLELIWIADGVVAWGHALSDVGRNGRRRHL